MSEPIRLAVVVNPELPPGLLANAAAAVAIGLGARIPGLGGARLTDRAGRDVDVSSNRPVPILAADPETLRALTLKAAAHDAALAVVPFPAFARALHVYADYERAFPERDLAAETIDGVAIAGPEKAVRSLTGSLRLLR